MESHGPGARWGGTIAVALLVVLAAAFAVPPAAAGAEAGRLTGGVRYQIPGWFKDSFLEIAEDAAEAAAAGRHVMLFIHLDECPYCEALLRESLVESDYSGWLRERFDVIAINVRGAREVAFDENTTLTERELVRALHVRQTPAVIFLDGDNNTVARVDGYRTPAEFKRILDYVDSGSYREMDLAAYVSSHADGPLYTLRPHPAFRRMADLSAAERPLLVLFEDAQCDGCNLLHETLLADEEINALLGRFDVVRLDADSDAPIIDPAGIATTPRAWSRALGMQARPGFVLFVDGRELVRIEGVLRHFHFATALRYVGERQFESYPSLRAYSRAHREALLRSGVDVDLGRQ